MKLTIHAGLHKTGSSSIQVFFDNQQDCIEEAKIYYPKDLYLNGAHHPFACAAKQGDKDTIYHQIQEWVRECSQRELDTIFVSSEDFEYLDTADIKLVKEYAEELGLEVNVIIYIRPQSDLIVSQYSQQVREGFCLESFHDFFDLQIELILDRYSSIFGKSLIVRSYYDSNFRPVNSVADIALILGITEIDRYTDPKSYTFNTRLSLLQLDFIRQLTKQSSELLSMNQEIRAQVLYHFIETYSWPEKLLDANKICLSARQLLTCNEHFLQENKRISEKYLSNPLAIEQWYENCLLSLGDVKERKVVSLNEPDVDNISIIDYQNANAALLALLNKLG